MVAALEPGGTLVLEAQPWRSYEKAVKKQDMSAAPFHNLKLLRFRPDHFAPFLLQLGLELVDAAKGAHANEGFCRDLLVFRKPADRARSPTPTGN